MSKFKVVWDTLQYFKDDRILKNDYNHGFKKFKIYNICPQNAFIKFHKTNNKYNQCMIRMRDPQIASLLFNQLSYAESYQIRYK